MSEPCYCSRIWLWGKEGKARIVDVIQAPNDVIQAPNSGEPVSHRVGSIVCSAVQQFVQFGAGILFQQHDAHDEQIQPREQRKSTAE